MKTIIGTLGNAVAGFYDRLPFYVRVPMIVGTVVFAASELNIDLNHSILSARLFGGQVADADAKSDDIQKTMTDLSNGKPVTGAGGLLATTVEQQRAAAEQARSTVPQNAAVGHAATESIEQILTKIARHEFVDSTEEMRLLDYRKSSAEADRMRAEADIKIAEATSARAKAQAENVVSQLITTEFGQPGTAATMVMPGKPDLGSFVLNMSRPNNHR